MFSLDQYRALHQRAGMLDRTGRGRIRVRGEDRKTYLHGILSNDILSLASGEWCYATLLTAQGRMVSDMRVFELGGQILLDLERSLAPSISAHLDTFVITEDVSVEDMTDQWVQIGLYGPSAREVLAGAGIAGGTDAPPFILPSSDLGVSGVDLVVASGEAETVRRSLVAAGAVSIDAETAEVVRIEAGIPRFLVDMDTTTIPLEAGIEDRAISLTKGCYVGQEVIIRVLHRGGGRVAKKLVGLHVGGNVQPGDRLYAAEREVGRITSAVDSPRAGRRIALGYVQRDFVEIGTALTTKTTAGDSPAVVVVVPFATA